MTRPTPTGLDRRQVSGMPWAATSARASHSGCSWARYGSSETTLTAARATPRPRSWTEPELAPEPASAPVLAPAPVLASRAVRPPWPGIALIAAAAVAVEMAVSARYGYVRDELYFLSAGQHLAFGYVDQPPLTPLLARFTAAVTGSTLAGFRVLPALALAALVVLTAVMSRQLGANRAGQILAALATATCGEYLGAMHELTTTTPDLVFWAVTLLLVMQLLASQDRRWWVAIGGCAGVASEAKWNIGFLVAALAAGFVFTDARRLLRSRYLLIGGLIAAVLAAPDVVWQAAHGWPGLDVFRALQSEAGHNRAVYWPAQILYTGVVLTPVWVAGAVWSLRSAAARRFRPVAIACVAVIALQFVLGGKAYYPGAAFTFLLAAGCVPLERRLAAGPRARRTQHGRRTQRGRAWPGRLVAPAVLAGAAMVAGAVLAAPVALSVLPARALHTVLLQKINYDLAETIGWPKLVALIAQEYGSLPAAQRRRTTILADNYGEAGAPVFIATGLKSSWAQAWPAFRNYS